MVVVMGGDCGRLDDDEFNRTMGASYSRPDALGTCVPGKNAGREVVNTALSGGSTCRA